MAESKLNPLLYLEREMSKRNLCCGVKNIFGALLPIWQTLSHERKNLGKFCKSSLEYI